MFPPVDWARTSVSCREGAARDQSLSLLCARFPTELVSSASSMPGAALAAPSGGSKRSGQLCPLAERWYSAGERQNVRQAKKSTGES